MMARKPDSSDLGIGGMKGGRTTPKKAINSPAPIDVGGWQYGSYNMSDVRKRLRGDPVIPAGVKKVIGDPNNP